MNKLVSKSLINCLVQSTRSISVTARLNSNIFNVQDNDDFTEKVLKNKKTVIVDFHAGWCGPCKILGPRLEKIMTGFEGKADFAKVDIDDLQDLAMNYNVSSIPTVIAVKNGKLVGQFIGLKEDDLIKKFVQDAIEK